MNTLLFSNDRARGLDLERATQTEWLEPDGRGGYASSTLAFCPTRQYHGLLVAAPMGEVDRWVFLSRFEELVRVAGREVSLSTARYEDVWHPQGYERLERFELGPYPRAEYRFGSNVIVRELCVARGQSTVLVRYSVEAAEGPVELELRPLMPLRRSTHLAHEEPLDEEVRLLPNGFRVQPRPELPPITFTLSRDHRFDKAPDWYRAVNYPADQERGYPGVEDQFTPGRVRVPLVQGDAVVCAVTIECPVQLPSAAWSREEERRLDAVRALPNGTSQADARVALAAADFLYRTSTGRTGILAGYPWFLEWGRDTFLSLPGLTLARGDKGTCLEVLLGAVPFLRNGLLPNVYAARPETSHYGSVDASLWFARAVDLYLLAGGSRPRVMKELLPALLEIAHAYWEGTELGIGTDDQGLLRAGSPELNATWMDARTPDGPVTPRVGFAVELNALWYALLDQLTELLEGTGRDDEQRLWSGRRKQVKQSFLERFWLADGDYLADRWNAGEADRSVRPNMVLAAALARSPLSKTQRASIVQRATDELLTPRGLRTLAPSDPAYRGRYEGTQEERDRAYHQGTAWPWLLGFYTEARLRAGAKATDLAELTALWDDLATELDRAGLHHLSEVFDGDAPQRPAGTFAQAWNTAEYLRARKLLQEGV